MTFIISPLFRSLVKQADIEHRRCILALLDANPYARFLDLGCGTGNISKAVKESFPNAEISCVDLAEGMIKMAQYKLSDYSGIQYYTGDFREFEFGNEYDVVVSSLALHHLSSEGE